jgi:hypothetical protein
MKPTTVVVSLAVLLLSTSPAAYAHCDTLDGPVAKAGMQALATGNLDHALVWIKPAAEPELRAAFKQTRAVRTLNKDARQLADRYFIETLVRLHRAGEGEPYTGLKPAGADLGPAIPAADDAIRSGSPAAVTKLITDAATSGVRDRLRRVIATRTYKTSDVAAGREYVEAYVTFLHYVEQLYVGASSTASSHEHHE